MSLLEVRGVGKRFAGLKALDDVSLEVSEGEILGLMGANGAGKTTLFAVIAGNLRPSNGEVRLDGRRIDRLPPEAIARRGIGRTFQIVRPFGALSVRENVAIAIMYGVAREPIRREALRKADAILAEFGLGGRAEDPASALTLAGRKRLELARVVGTGARLILLDEVMAGLTAAEVDDTIGLVRDLRDRRGMTILIIEHVMRALSRLSDRLVVMHHGVVVASGDPETISSSEIVMDAYFGRAG